MQKNNDNLISIIIPTYNRGKLIGKTLDSVLTQTYQNWECIIVDDGSSDNTDEVVGEYVEKDSRFKYYHRPDEHLPGGNGARNYGFKMCRGEYLCWLDSDDLLIDTYLETHFKILDSKKNDVSVCGIELFKNNSYITKKWLSDDWKNSDYKSFCEGYIMFIYGLGTPCFVWNINFLKNKDLFNESLKRSQEYEFFCRILLLSKPKISKTPKALVLYRQHESNKSKEVDSGNSEKIISGIIAKKMVIAYVKKSISISPKLEEYFIADALAYLKYDTINIEKHVFEVLLEMDVSNIKRLILNYKIITKYTGINKIKKKEIKLLQNKVPKFLLYIYYKLFLKIKKIIKKVVIKIKLHLR